MMSAWITPEAAPHSGPSSCSGEYHHRRDVVPNRSSLSTRSPPPCHYRRPGRVGDGHPAPRRRRARRDRYVAVRVRARQGRTARPARRSRLARLPDAGPKPQRLARLRRRSRQRLRSRRRPRRTNRVRSTRRWQSTFRAVVLPDRALCSVICAPAPPNSGATTSLSTLGNGVLLPRCSIGITTSAAERSRPHPLPDTAFQRPSSAQRSCADWRVRSAARPIASREPRCRASRTASLSRAFAGAAAASSTECAVTNGAMWARHSACGASSKYSGVATVIAGMCAGRGQHRRYRLRSGRMAEPFDGVYAPYAVGILL